MSYLLDLQAPQQHDGGSRAVPWNPLSTVSAGLVCLVSTFSISLC